MQPVNPPSAQEQQQSAQEPNPQPQKPQPHPTLETGRLTLRPWRETDAENLYEYARNPAVGPIAGWPVHTSIENSRDIIRDILSAEGTYAITVKGTDTAIGSIGLMFGAASSNLGLPPDEAEVGYWIGEPFWGRGLVPEATGELIRHAFEDLGATAIWCGYFDGNDKSRRVAEKCGFRPQFTKEEFYPLINETKKQHITRLTRQEWASRRGQGLTNPCTSGSV